MNKLINLNTRNIVNYLLLPLAMIFYLLVLFRKALYHVNLLTTYKFDVPVIVVGNITVGGTGKTPVVIALVQHFKKQGKKVGVVSRGYGGQLKGSASQLINEQSTASEIGDESILIYQQTQVPVMVNKNRSQAIKDVIEQHRVNIIISDDGLQHYAMSRTVEICVENGFGNGFFLPAGPLRESTRRLKNVDFVIKNRFKPIVFINLKTQQQQPLNYFKNQTCYAVAGIAQPSRFFSTLNNLGVHLIQRPFKDHHLFIKQDLDFKEDYPILMSAKDCVKCERFATSQMWYLQVETNLSDDFLNQLDAKL